jgi:DNA-binding HxlR family transcriptional regulator
MLKKLGWVEETSEEEMAAIQDYYPPVPPRSYYRLTKKGKDASNIEWSNPKLILYLEFALEYHREKRSEHHYSKKAPTKSRRMAGHL